jgi:hypothetical protein
MVDVVYAKTLSIEIRMQLEVTWGKFFPSIKLPCQRIICPLINRHPTQGLKTNYLPLTRENNLNFKQMQGQQNIS